jgi:heme oxygenase
VPESTVKVQQAPEVALPKAPTLRERLKSDTQDQHDRAEKNPFNHRLFSPNITVQNYLANLVVLQRLHRCLEDLFVDHPLTMIACSRNLSQLALKDINYLESETKLEAPKWSKEDLKIDISRINMDPYFTLGVFYVLKGSTNGNMIAALLLNKNLGLTSEGGLSFLSACLDDKITEVPRQIRPTNSEWAQIAASIDELNLTEQQYSLCLSGAKFTFELFNSTANQASLLEA